MSKLASARGVTAAERRYVDRLLSAWEHARRTMWLGIGPAPVRCNLGRLYRTPPAPDAGDIARAQAKLLELTEDQYLAIDKAVLALPDETRRVVRAWYRSPGLTQKELACQLHIGLSTFERALQKGRELVFVALLPDSRWNARLFNLGEK